tara:strand:+ start:84 stop:473 length:390 start_codon:yes stop_codon:yes gene_type:complete
MISIKDAARSNLVGYVAPRRMMTTPFLVLGDEKIGMDTFVKGEEYVLKATYCVRYIVHSDPSLSDQQWAEKVEAEKQQATRILSHSVYGGIIHRLSKILQEASYQSRDMDDPLVEEIEDLMACIQEAML